MVIYITKKIKTCVFVRNIWQMIAFDMLKSVLLYINDVMKHYYV